MKNILLTFISAFLLSTGVYCQSTCNCFPDSAQLANSFTVAPMTLGIDTGGTPLYQCYDCSSQSIKLPFSFCFYGKEYDSVYISNKGVISFGNPVFTIDSTGLPIDDTAMLAGYYSDIDTRTTNPAEPCHATVSYSISPTHFTALWNGVPYSTFDHDNFNTFSITITNGSDPILPSGNNVSYCYSYMQWASGNPNEEGWDGIPAVIGVNKGDGHYAQFGEFDTVLLFEYGGYLGPFDTNSDFNWLDGRSFIFNTCVSGNAIPPVILDSNPNLCNAYWICPENIGDTISFRTSFLCGEKGQTATLTVSSDLPGITNTFSDTDAIYTDATRLTLTMADTGAHVITVIATDNSVPPLKDSVSYTVYVYKNCADTLLGVNPVAMPNAEITLYPNPNHGQFTIALTHPELVPGVQTIEIYNTLGEKVYSNSYQLSANGNEPITINLSNQPSGMYLYRMVNESGILIGNGKFVIQ